ncbi:similar to Saccharomyces cerevisiae YLR305C STT4 Phosphatidylinositol-4-kinase that functions in the Pkc1p protein kinase pathway [Maudiozyma saulgeensis]|uniref:1-phosphatidylinositol 4-kinase n=1 Tax=Maudiozyma saulgeensis TaxID=1789683 RepID=A0A1X7R572_9SACH|nr:similar to Saccharomyces cerevisiae YLR305C STT4 Phosphatidylinositol-4-kinase that functions in the Pkc1p protein kinase pathway [Kazachstania saulgeensis]
MIGDSSNILSLRARALSKLANTYANTPTIKKSEKTQEVTPNTVGNNLDIITRSLPIFYSSDTSRIYTIPLTLNEWEIILAISGTVPNVESQAIDLLDNVISKYFIDSPRQRVSDVLLAKFRLNDMKNPNEIITFQLTKYLITISSKFPSAVHNCLGLFERYLAEVKNLYIAKPSSIFSLLGLMNAFIEDNSSLELSSFMWKNLSTLFTQEEFLSQIETNLASSPSFMNDSIVQYFDAGYEISGPLFINLLSKMQVSLACRVLGIPYKQESLMNYLVEQQVTFFKNQANLSNSSKRLTLPGHVLKDVERSKPLLQEICKFILSYSLSMEESSFEMSDDSRAKFAFDTRAYFIQFLCLTPYLQNSNLMGDYVDLLGLCMDRYFLSDTITPQFVSSIVTAASLLNFLTEELSEALLRSLPLLVGSEHMKPANIKSICETFSIGLLPLNEDSIVSTIYSINNLLTNVNDKFSNNLLKERQLTVTSGNSFRFDDIPRSNSFDALRQLKNQITNTSSNDKPDKKSEVKYQKGLFENCVTATTTIASNYDNHTITNLTITILTQKVGVISDDLDEVVLKALADITPCCTTSQFSMILKFFRSIDAIATKNDNHKLIDAIKISKNVMSSKLLASKSFEDEIYKMYLIDLLDSIISSGEVEKPEHHRPHTEISLVADQIAGYLRPLATLLPKPGKKPINLSTDEALTNMFRNVWFNMVVHGFFYDSDIVKTNYDALLTIAFNSPPLASNFPANNKEMSLDMNTILRRGSSNSNIKQQKQIISRYMNANAVQQRAFSNSKVMFLAATILLETVRCEAGDCSKILLYLTDPSIGSSNIDKSIISMSIDMVNKFVKLTEVGNLQLFNSKSIASQLNDIFLCMADKNTLLQDASFQCCDLFIKSIPSSLCHHNSLYTLLDLLTTLFDSVVDCQTNKFDVTYEFYLNHSQRKILIPGSKSWRTSTLSGLRKAAKDWLRFLLNCANQDTKILLQSYVSDIGQSRKTNQVEYGVSFAIEMAGLIIPADKELYRISYKGSNRPNTISSFIAQHSWRSKFLVDTAIASSKEDISRSLDEQVVSIRQKIDNGVKISIKEITDFLDMSAALLILSTAKAGSIISDIVHVPFEIFSSDAFEIATNVWLTVIKERPDMAHILLSEVAFCWMNSIDAGQGLYSQEFDVVPTDNQMMEYSPYNKKGIDRSAKLAADSLKPHRYIVKFFSSHFEGTRFESKSLLRIFTRTVEYGLSRLNKASCHPFARMIRNEFLVFGLAILKANQKQNTIHVIHLCHSIVDAALSWFIALPTWPFGSNELKNNADLTVLLELYKKADELSGLLKRTCGKEFELLKYFLANEIQIIETWLAPLAKIEGANKNDPSEILVTVAFNKNPSLAVNLVKRYPKDKLTRVLETLVAKDPLSCVGIPEALDIYLDTAFTKKDLHPIVYWTPVSPLKSIGLFLQKWNKNEFILQYGIYSLESHDVNVTFFYVPQIVQCLRYDHTDYVEKLILDTAKISVLFSHQIIWNMLANCYIGDDGLVEDAIKPTLDRVREKMVKTFSKKHYEFYKEEFGFFSDVTSISGKLKPYIKKSKAEKKQKIDEEMKKIIVRPGAYLPSNPDGIVIDINRTSGKPLQSHAKAPFMATFKIKKTIEDPNTGDAMEVEKWQAAIFKVGDDCRQDVLALQLISIFRTIWSAIGLDVYVFPYRVTATAPGCGVIDVLPNSVSRDMLGREAVNGLYEYFISKFGDENTIEFQRARNNFVKSLAGYSVISYLLQFKDRHNGNIMYDDQGHCLHIDFGFIFDIVPGGVKFEAVPFKLTKEMVRVMGGSDETPAYHAFEELCIKAYMAARPHMDSIIECIEPMLGSGLPCFKGGKTIKNLEARFQPQRTDHEAAMYMKGLIKKSFESVFTKGYDEFQRITNGIPY